MIEVLPNGVQFQLIDLWDDNPATFSPPPKRSGLQFFMPEQSWRQEDVVTAILSEKVRESLPKLFETQSTLFAKLRSEPASVSSRSMRVPLRMPKRGEPLERPYSPLAGIAEPLDAGAVGTYMGISREMAVPLAASNAGSFSTQIFGDMVRESTRSINSLMEKQEESRQKAEDYWLGKGIIEVPSLDKSTIFLVEREKVVGITKNICPGMYQREMLTPETIQATQAAAEKAYRDLQEQIALQFQLAKEAQEMALSPPVSLFPPKPQTAQDDDRENDKPSP